MEGDEKKKNRVGNSLLRGGKKEVKYKWQIQEYREPQELES